MVAAREGGTTRVPSQERACRTRASILAAAAAEFSARGYAATTAKGIAARARTATGSFYQYFTSKDEVLREIAAERQLAVVTAALSGLEDAAHDGATDAAFAVRGRLRAMVDAVMAYHAADRGLHAVLTERRHADQELDALTSAGEAQIVQRIAALIERLSPDATDATATAFVLFAAVEGAVHAHVLGRPIVDDARFCAALVDAVFRMVSFSKE